MHVGIHVMRFDYPGGADHLRQELVDGCEAAEQAGLAWMSVMDHYFQMVNAGFPADDPMLEAYTTLGFMAARTSRIQLGALVTGVTYRHPGLLAKIATTLDVLSGGRATLGIGAAWYDREHHGLGVPYPPLAERFERLEETLRICLQMWDPENDGPFEGEHYRLAETLCVPAPVSSPHPEIMIGGKGEKKTLRLVAQYADACNLFGGSAEELEHKLGVLRRHCDDVGRDYDTIRKTAIAPQGLDPLADTDGFASLMEQYAALGISLVTISHDGVDPVAWTERLLGTVLPRIKDL